MGRAGEALTHRMGVRPEPYKGADCALSSIGFSVSLLKNMTANKDAPLGSIENPVRFLDQDFTTLLEECLQSDELFSDPTFEPDQKSIGMPEDPDPKNAIEWKRPKEIYDNAVFVEGTTGTTDICQGQLGNCWLLAALSCLTMHPKLFVKVVPPEQSLAKPYAGIFHFRFWQYGEWVEVVVDDKLPVREGRLLFSYSHTRHEFWSALVEKAYAKLMGSYGSLKGGNISEGMEDFTGGIAYSLDVSSRTPRVLWRCLTAALSRGSLLSCFIQAKNYGEVGKVTGDGLIKGHAYAITDTDKVTKAGTSEEILLYKLRNPWGFIEYRGPWSDKGKEWEDINQSEKQRIELKKKEDGEFWISADDFSNLFEIVELCSLKPDSLEVGIASSGLATWTISEHEGSWIPGSSAGGSRRYRKTFWQNSQFELTLREQDEPQQEEDEDEEDEDGEEDEEMTAEEKKREEKQKQKAKKCTVLVELLQKNRRRKDKIHFLYIGFHIYKVEPELQGICLTQSFFLNNRPVGRSGKYKCQRGVWRKLHLEPGNYIIVASSYRPNQPGDFFVRIFSKTGNTLGTHDFICSSGILPVMSAPPSQEDHMRVQKTFDMTADPVDKLNAKESMKLFNSVLVKDYHLPLDVCRQLIFEEDHCISVSSVLLRRPQRRRQTKGRCTLSRDQAETLLSNLRNLQVIFFKYDEDSSGTMSPFELNAALEAVGMLCDSKVVQLLTARFASGEFHMPFHSFVSCVTRLRKLFALYESETSQEVKDRGINAWLLQFLVV